MAAVDDKCPWCGTEMDGKKTPTIGPPMDRPLDGFELQLDERYRDIETFDEPSVDVPLDMVRQRQRDNLRGEKTGVKFGDAL